MSKQHLTIYYDNGKTYTARDMGIVEITKKHIHYCQVRKTRLKEVHTNIIVSTSDMLGYKFVEGDMTTIIRLKNCTMVGGLIK